jgi:hypothetical protein
VAARQRRGPRPQLSPSQRGPRAFGHSICDVKFLSHFHAPTNVPRYNGDTNPSVWLEDYRLACHTGDDFFVIKNLPPYLGDSARIWLEHLPREKINDWTDLRRVFVENFQGTYMRPASSGSYATASSSWERVSVSAYDASPSAAPSSPVRPTTTPSQGSRMARRARPSSSDSDATCLARPTSSSTSQATTPTVRKQSPYRSPPLALQEEEEERQAPS